MVKLVNTLVSKTSAERLPGSIPGIPTKPNRLVRIKFLKLDLDFCIYFEHLTDLFIQIINQNE